MFLHLRALYTSGFRRTPESRKFNELDPGFRRGDEYFSLSLDRLNVANDGTSNEAMRGRRGMAVPIAGLDSRQVNTAARTMSVSLPPYAGRLAVLASRSLSACRSS